MPGNYLGSASLILATGIVEIIEAAVGSAISNTAISRRARLHSATKLAHRSGVCRRLSQPFRLPGACNAAGFQSGAPCQAVCGGHVELAGDDDWLRGDGVDDCGRRYLSMTPNH